jgi:hypothetical protein
MPTPVLGNQVTLTVFWTDESGQPADAPTVCKIWDPSGTLVGTYTSGTTPRVIRQFKGKYQLVYLPQVAGQFLGRFEASGPFTGAVEQQFSIAASAAP